MDEAVGGPAEAEDGEDQEGNGSSERQAWRPESEGCKADLTFQNDEMKVLRIFAFHPPTNLKDLRTTFL